jgi:hypothetical protein
MLCWARSSRGLFTCIANYPFYDYRTGLFFTQFTAIPRPAIQSSAVRATSENMASTPGNSTHCQGYGYHSHGDQLHLYGLYDQCPRNSCHLHRPVHYLWSVVHPLEAECSPCSENPERTNVNIFFLDRDIRRAVRYHSDQHVVKMALETTQILCSVLWRYGVKAPYLQTHANHPSVLWAGDSLRHYRWTCRFGLALCDEYTHRFVKIHKCRSVITSLPKDPPIPDAGWLDPPQAMPEEHRAEDAVEGYRRYYSAEKSSFTGKGPAKWSRRRVPPFMHIHDIKAGDLLK